MDSLHLLDRIKSFLAFDDLLRYERKNQPQEEEPTDGTMTMETTWSSAPSTPRGETRRRCLQVAGTFATTSSARNTDDLLLPMFQWTRIRQWCWMWDAVVRQILVTPEKLVNERWMSWWYVNGLCYRSLFTASSLFIVHVFRQGLLTQRGQCFFTMPNGNGRPGQNLLWKIRPCCHDWNRFDNHHNMHNHGANFWFGLGMLPDAGLRRHMANVHCSVFTVPCPLKFFVQGPLRFPWVVGLKQKSWTKDIE